MELPLNHSIENVYIQLGQYDRYSIFTFYPGSDAYNEYGATVYGDIIYTPSQRERLRVLIQSEDMRHNDGQIFIKGASNNNELNLKLKNIGFWARDIQRLSTMDLEPVKNEYENQEIKQIPNTVEIEFESGSFSLEGMLMHIYESRMDSGAPLIHYEFQKYLTLLYIHKKIEPTSQLFIDHILDLDNHFRTDTTITVFSYLNRRYKSDVEIKATLTAALNKRRVERIDNICKQLGISRKHIEKFKRSDKDGYTQLMQVVLSFEPETIPIWGWKHSIYWDFDRFIHIYLRHYRKFFIEGSSKGQGTIFQYEFKDIRRLIEIILEANKEEIELRLSEGRPYNRYDEQGYYYNGNYYTFRIAKDGKIMQFHSHEKN